MLDHPNHRSSHKRSTPRGGGVVFVFVAALATVFELLFFGSGRAVLIGVVLLPLPLAIVGLLDDRHDISPVVRFGVQLATALLVTLFSPLPLPWFATPLVLIAFTAVINFTNFMYGLDCLVAGCMTLTIGALAIALDAPWSLWSLVAALLAFLLWNWCPAKVFMGDVGSTFLGAVFAGLILQAHGWPEAFSYLLVATPLLADACLCVLRRLLAGLHVFQAHRLHLYQRLHQAGWSHAKVSFIYMFATGVLAFAMLFGGLNLLFSLSVSVLLVGVWLDQRVAVPFSLASRAEGD